MSKDGHSDMLARFDALLGTLEGCTSAEQRVRLIRSFVSEETGRREEADPEFLRARYEGSDEELVARIQVAPDMGGETLVEMMSDSARASAEASDSVRGEDYRSAFSIATLVFLVVVQGGLAILELSERGPTSKVAVLGIGALMSLALGVFFGLSWLRDVRRRERERDLRLEEQSKLDEEFDRRNRLLLNGAEAIQISAAHLKLSDDLMKDAIAGVLSPRGACDAAFESGYLALLSAVTRDERVKATHPSDRLVALASRRLGLSSSQGVALARIRYSYDEWRSFAEVVTWAEEVRLRAREVEGK
jgi:hypothetical protein